MFKLKITTKELYYDFNTITKLFLIQNLQLVALLLFDCENHLILVIIIKIIILNIISVISIVSMVNNMTAPVAENIAETAKQTIKTDVVESQQLLGPTGKVSIQHNGELYQLRQTRTGKLILTK